MKNLKTKGQDVYRPTRLLKEGKTVTNRRPNDVTRVHPRRNTNWIP